MPNDAPAGRRAEDTNELVLSYLAVRRFVGGIGVALPLLLMVYALTVEGGDLRESISAYFHSGGREVLVGGLTAVAVFLWAYKGYVDDPRWPSDRLVARIAALAAFAVAIFPMGTLAPGDACSWMQCLFGGLTRWVHYAAALVFFAALAVFCLVNFRRSAPGAQAGAAKRAKNRIFAACGWLIVGCLAAIVLGFALGWQQSYVFWAETIGVWAFSASWLFKGAAFPTLLRLAGRGG